MTTISAHIFVFEFIAMDWAMGPGEFKQRMHVKRQVQTKYYTPQCDVTPKRARLGPIRSLTAVLYSTTVVGGGNTKQSGRRDYST